jgi:multiple sugar transport system permease protein
MSRGLAARVLSYAGLTIAAIGFVAPVLFMLAGSFKPEARVLTDAGSVRAFLPTDWNLDNYRDVFARVDFLRFLLNSLFITGAVVLGGLIVNSLAGYAFARTQWRGRAFAFALVLAILILPLEAIAVPLFYQVTVLGWRDTYVAQILPFVANAFSIYLFYTFFLGLPRELEEAARIDGAGPMRTFLTIIVPNSRPVFATVAILSFLVQWGVYLWPLMVTSGEAVRPLPLAVATFYTLPPLQWGDIFAFGVMMVSPILLVFLFFQRWFIRGVVATGIRG